MMVMALKPSGGDIKSWLGSSFGFGPPGHFL